MELPQKTFAATTDSQIKKLVGKMDDYEITVVRRKTKTIKLTKKTMAKAAALSINVSEKDGISKSELGYYNTRIEEYEGIICLFHISLQTL